MPRSIPTSPRAGFDAKSPGGRADQARHDQLPADPVDLVLDLFRARGGRVTASRRLLLRCLFEQHEHCTAEELVSAVNHVDPDVHRSTIYRNLDELEQLGVVEHVHLGHGPATYHLSTQRHGHLVCDVCGTATPIPDDFLDGVAAAARAQYGFRLRPRHFALVGTCASCASGDTGPASG